MPSTHPSAADSSHEKQGTISSYHQSAAESIREKARRELREFSAAANEADKNVQTAISYELQTTDVATPLSLDVLQECTESAELIQALSPAFAIRVRNLLLAEEIDIATGHGVGVKAALINALKYTEAQSHRLSPRAKEGASCDYPECSKPACRRRAPPATHFSHSRAPLCCDARFQCTHRSECLECADTKSVGCDELSCPRSSPPPHCSHCRPSHPPIAGKEHQHNSLDCDHDSPRPIRSKCFGCDHSTCRKDPPPKHFSRCRLAFYCNANCQRPRRHDPDPGCRDIDSVLVTLAWLGAAWFFILRDFRSVPGE